MKAMVEIPILLRDGKRGLAKMEIDITGITPEDMRHASVETIYNPIIRPIETEEKQ